MREVAIETWAQFDHLVRPRGDYWNFAFRGQSDASWALWTSLSRYLLDFGVSPKVWREQEERTIRTFQRKAPIQLTHVPADGDTFQWVAMIQHYGGPTRLLDFTWSPYVAAFFALEMARGDAAVFAFDVLRMPERITERYASLRIPGAFEDVFLPGTKSVIAQGEPGVMNPRLNAQDATFVIPGKLSMPVDEQIEEQWPGALTKLILRHGLRDEAMASLYDRNVHNASLFPDLTGLATSLRYELESNWAFNPKTGEQYERAKSRVYSHLRNTTTH